MSLHTVPGGQPDSLPLEVRPLRPEDEPLVLGLYGNESEERLRPACLGVARVLSRDALARLCRFDHPQDAGFVAEWKDTRGAPRLAGVSRSFFDPETNTAEVALDVAAARQGEGISHRLLKPLIASARERGIRELITGAHAPMMSIATRFHFLFAGPLVAGDGTAKVVRDLEKGIDLTKYDRSRIDKSDVRFLVSSMSTGDGVREEIEDFFLDVDRDYAVQCLDELSRDPDPRINSSAVELLVLRLGPEALPWVEKWLADEDVNARCGACSLLGDVGGPEAVARLLRCLREDPSDWVRYSAVEALERCGDPSAVPALREAARTDKGTNYEGWPIRDRAKEAVRAITRRKR